MSTRGRSSNCDTSNSLVLRVPLHDVAIEDDAVRVHDAEHAVRARLERLEAQRVGLGDLARGIDLVVEHDEHTLPARRGLGGDAEALEQVRRPLVSQRARVAHRADDDDRLVAANREIEEVGRLLQRVGPARDDHARQIRVLLEERVDPPGKLHPLLQRDRAARDVGELLELGAHVAVEAGHGQDELFGGETAAVAVGNRAAGGEQAHLRERRGGRRRRRRRGCLSRLGGRKSQPRGQRDCQKEGEVCGGEAHGA